jgi:hypothetical protein
MEKDTSEIYVSKNLKECKELINEYQKFLENYELDLDRNQMTFIISKEVDTNKYIKIIPKEGEIKSIKRKKLEDLTKNEFIASKNIFRAKIGKQEFRVFYENHNNRIM